MSDTRGRDFTSSSKDVRGKEVLEELYKKPEILYDHQVISELKKKLSDNKIVEAAFDYYKKRFEIVKAKAQKFKAALLNKYATVGLSVAQLIEKAKKYKKRYDLTDGEFHMFINLIVSDRSYPYPNLYNIPSTPMSRALGYSIDAVMGDKLSFSEAEAGDLQAILTKCAEYKQLHSQLVMQSLMYRDCAPEALTGEFDRKKNLAFNFVHPVIAALFLPKIRYLEEHIILASIANIVKTKSEGKPISTLPEYELYWDMITDPNQTACVAEGHKAISDLKQRTILQTRLWESVMYLRQGKYYMDDLGKFMSAIENCQNSIFDAPDLTYIRDEGTILRRILNAFSLRPTVVSVAPLFGSPTTAFPMHSAPLSYTQVTTIPMINMRLPMNITGGTTQVALREALNQPQWFIEGKTLVPKTQTIVYSRDVLFFYANRRFKSMNFMSLNQPYAFNALPQTLSGIESINKATIQFEPEMIVGDDTFILRSVVVVESARTDTGKEFITGCNALISIPINPTNGIYQDTHIIYDPQLAGSLVPDQSGVYGPLPPITYVEMAPNPFSTDPHVESFTERAQTRGTIFMYAKRTF